MLTGIHQHIGNYPGVTVEKKSGHYHDGKHRIEVVDLPGTYSLTSYSQEERVTRDFILLERPELLVVVLDAANFRRHLYLVYQLLEMQVPVVICMNMMDMAERRGLSIDIERLENELGVTVVPTVGKKSEGAEALRDAIMVAVTKADAHESTGWKMNYGDSLEAAMEPIVKSLAEKEHLVEDFSPRWLAVKLFELDRDARRIIQHHTHDDKWEEILETVDQAILDYEKKHEETPLKVISRVRDQNAEEIEQKCITRVKSASSFSDRIDKIACHPLLGLGCAILVMIAAFLLSFQISGELNWIPGIGGEWRSPVGVCEYVFGDWIPGILDSVVKLQDGPLRSLIYDGIIAGIGGVIVFVPVIFFIFLVVSSIEQCGYVARLGIVLHRVMKFFGLHGNSVLPMILGGGIVGGCAIPAIMATRTMREPKERLLTILVIPFMNCGAKLPVYSVLTMAFFGGVAGAVVFASLIVVSWGVALVSASLLSKTMVKGEPTPLIVELPAYQVPSPRVVLMTALQQSWWFVKKAGTVILAVAVILWALMYYPRLEPLVENGEISEHSQLEHSYAGRAGRTLEPIGKLAGFDWRDNIALFGGFAAKEVIISTLLSLYSLDDEEPGPVDGNNLEADETEEAAEGDAEEAQRRMMANHLRQAENWSPLKAYAMMIFVMLYAPCFPTCVTIWRETGSFAWMILSMAFSTLVALTLAVAIFQIGSLFV